MKRGFDEQKCKDVYIPVNDRAKYGGTTYCKWQDM